MLGRRNHWIVIHVTGGLANTEENSAFQCEGSRTKETTEDWIDSTTDHLQFSATYSRMPLPDLAWDECTSGVIIGRKWQDVGSVRLFALYAARL